MEINLSCKEENLLLSQIADFEGRKYSVFLNFGDDNANSALSQFPDSIESNLLTLH